MRIPEKVVAEVVLEASTKMTTPTYAQALVGSWVQAQPAATEYIKAHVNELGGSAGVVSAVFHASLMAMCFARHVGRGIRKMTFAELDSVAGGDREAAIQKRQPALYDYLMANVEQPEMRKVLILLALGMDLVV